MTEALGLRKTSFAVSPRLQKKKESRVALAFVDEELSNPARD